VDPSWGDGFPAGVPPLMTPRPERAGNRIDMAEAGNGEQLIYGWFPAEHVEGRSYRWAGERAAALIRLEAPARRLRLDYAHVPVDIGGVDVSIRRLALTEPLTPVWATRLRWQYIARTIENHPLDLPPGDYEVAFRVANGWREPPLRTRSLGFALANLALETSYEIVPGGLDMASPSADDQLVCGWFEAEPGRAGTYRWGAGHAAVVIRLADRASSARMNYRLPPGSIGALSISVRPLDTHESEWSTRIAWQDDDWHQESFPIRLARGDYLVSFDAETTWSNPDNGDAGVPAENRALGFALSDLRFT
jgi:hypothetical protein